MGRWVDGWMDGWRDGEVLIIGKVVGWSGRVPQGLPSVELRPWSVIPGASFFRAFFRRLFFPIFGDVGSIWAGFGRPKRNPKSIFGGFFSMFFSNAFRHRFLMVFGRLKT